jgi:hypothetical protein
MANLIDESENVLILLLLLAIMALGGWAVYEVFKSGGALESIKKFFKGLPDPTKAIEDIKNATDKAFGGTGTPGTSDYVSATQNAAGWWKDYFGTSASDADEYTPAQQQSMNEITQNYQIPPTSAIQKALSSAGPDITNFFSTLQNNPGSLPMF